MNQSNRTPGQAEGTEQDIDAALGKKQPQKSGNRGSQQDPRAQEPGTTPGQAEGTEEQAEGSLRRQK